MDNALVVVESPSKAKTIEKYLGKGYKVKASKGHVVDLPKSGLGVDVDNNYKPDYQVMPGKNKTVKELKDALKGKDKLIIAVDPDREGEAIGWHVANKLGLIDLKGKKKKSEIKLERIVFTEITKNAVQEALARPRELDLNLLNAQQTRRLLDRLVGYKLSPLLWKKIRFGLSAGRVQSVAVKFIVDRELERQAFNPEEYWRIFAFLDEAKKNTKPGIKLIESEAEEKLPEATDSLKFELAKIDAKPTDLDKAELTKAVLEKLAGVDWKISKVEQKQSKRYPKPPFTTSTLQQTSANWLGFAAKKTMSVAQKLYENGLITYMRTDSTNLAEQAVEAAREFIKSELGKDYLPDAPIFYRTKAKVAQEAHEAIRPADFSKTPESLNLEGDEAKLYKLIWQRALASQLNPALLENITASIVLIVDGTTYEFRTTGQRVLFPGYLKIYPEKVSENVLPQLLDGQELYLDNLYGTQHFTQPPARFSEATLIKELEKFGIGRPSTYAPIISTILARGYVEKEGAYFKPTDTGVVVNKLLSQHFPNIVDKDFTAEMETKLDEIANGETDWQKFLDSFYKPFAKELEDKEGKIARGEYTELAAAPDDIRCPVDGAKMVVKLGRYGRFYSCTNFPDCKGMLNIDGTSEADVQAKSESPEFKESYEDSPLTDDGRPFLLKKGRYGEFWAHPDYPKVKDARPLIYRKQKLIELFGEPPLTDDGRDFLFRTGKFGNYWAHPDYPKVKQTVPIKKIDKQK